MKTQTCVCVCAALGHNSSDYVHVLVEAFRLALTDALSLLGDPDHVTIPLQTLLEKSYSRQRAQSVSMDRCGVCLTARLGAGPYQSPSVDSRYDCRLSLLPS